MTYNLPAYQNVKNILV